MMHVVPIGCEVMAHVLNGFVYYGINFQVIVVLGGVGKLLDVRSLESDSVSEAFDLRRSGDIFFFILGVSIFQVLYKNIAFIALVKSCALIDEIGHCRTCPPIPWHRLPYLPALEG